MQLFSPGLASLFILLRVSFTGKKFLILIEIKIYQINIYHFFLSWIMLLMLHLNCHYQSRVMHTFASRNFETESIIFCLSSLHIDSQLFHHHLLWKQYFSLNRLCTFAKNHLTIFISVYFLAVFCSIDLYLYIFSINYYLENWRLSITSDMQMTPPLWQKAKKN